MKSVSGAGFPAPANTLMPSRCSMVWRSGRRERGARRLRRRSRLLQEAQIAGVRGLDEELRLFEQLAHLVAIVAPRAILVAAQQVVRELAARKLVLEEPGVDET